jgi:hypothetical protein
MFRKYLLTTGFCLLMLTDASAEVYRCRTADGRLVMTDNQTNLPAGCKPMDNPPGTGSFNIMPSTDGSAVQNPAKQKEEDVKPDTSKHLALQSEAEALVQSYNDAVTRRYHSSRVIEQQAAIRQITEFRHKKQEMLDSLAASALSHDERKRVHGILNKIPPR